ncbi:MAG: hypothetical protein R2862_11885 [Thermoanaerobaculia bacterium]
MVFLAGLLPAAVAFLVRYFLKEPERWVAAAASGQRGRFAELFDERHRRRTLSGFLMALVALLTWWSCNAFIPVVASVWRRSRPQRAFSSSATRCWR